MRPLVAPHHLDLAARTALEELLGAFDGALVCVSHDRAFLDALCTQILVVEGGTDHDIEMFRIDRFTRGGPA